MDVERNQIADNAIQYQVQYGVIGGGYDEAIAKAAESNSEIKLSLTAEQRGNFAWRLVVLGAHSKSETAKLSGIAERTVANMRSAKRALEQVNIELPKTWREAMRLAKHVEFFM